MEKLHVSFVHIFVFVFSFVFLFFLVFLFQNTTSVEKHVNSACCMTEIMSGTVRVKW